jgi:predicted transcriptional regulator
MLLLLSILLNIYLYVNLRKERKNAKTLFIRAWKLETSLIDVYTYCREEGKKKIENALDSIKAL